MTEAVARYQPRPSALMQYTDEEMDLIKTQIAPGTTDRELALFLTVANRRGLDPFRGQIFAIKRQQFDKKSGGYVDRMTIQVAHAGLLALAERTNGYRGTTEPQFCGEDGRWVDVWLGAAPPAAAKVGVHRRGFAEPVYGIAVWSEYVQTGRDGQPMGLWKDKPTHMLEKCALSKALRRAFPDMESDFTDEDVAAEEPDPAGYVEAEPPLNLRAIPAIADTATDAITLTNDATGETMVIEVEPAVENHSAGAGKMVEPEPAPAPKPARKAAEPAADDVTPMSALWGRVQVWAKARGTDPQRLRYYLATPAGVPERVGQDAIRAWLGVSVDHTLDRLYTLYVDGETAQGDGSAPSDESEGRLL